jgi:protein phosphatase
VGSHVGYVAIYRGIPQSVAGIPLNRVATTTALPVSDLPYYDQQQVERTIDAPTEAQAERVVQDLAGKAAACRAESPPLGCPQTTASGPGSEETTTPGSTAGPTPSGTAEPAPTSATATSSWSSP